MKIVITCLMAVVLFGVAGIAQADFGSFVNVSAMSDSLEFGRPTFISEGDTFFGPGSVVFPSVRYMSSASLTVKVDSNCLHGPVVASITALKHPRSGSIPPERIFIKSPTTNGYVTMGKPVAVSRPETGSHDIELDFRVGILPSDYSGRYTGTITFTIMPPPP